MSRPTHCTKCLDEPITMDGYSIHCDHGVTVNRRGISAFYSYHKIIRSPEPRYDDVYHAGVKWLDSL